MDEKQNKVSTALVIGKFAPLHKGHQFLLESALMRAERVIVLVYDVPELTRVPVGVRMGWIKRLYPRAQVIDAGVGPKETGDSPKVNRLHSDYAKKQLPPGVKIDFVFSSEDYGQFLAQALGAENVVVDKERVRVPISAGKIREDVGRHGDYLEDFVRADVIHYDGEKS